MTWEWGLAGENTWSRFSPKDQKAIGPASQSYTEGPVRIIEAVEEFTTPTFLPESVPNWVYVGEGERGRKRFVMPLPESNRDYASNLARYSIYLRREHQVGNFSSDEPKQRDNTQRLFDEFNLIIDRLLERVQLMHLYRVSVGVLAPTSVCWYRTADGPMIILPDLGFVWGGFGHLPEWLADQGAWQPLWEDAPRNLITADLDPERDIRTIARLLDWTLSGGLNRDIPKPKDGHDPRRSATYSILYDAMIGKYRNIESLRTALQGSGARPGDHFLFETYRDLTNDRKSSGSWKQKAFVGMLLCAGIGTAGYFGYQEFVKNPPEVRSVICPECPPTSKLHPLLLQYDSTKEPREQTKLFVQMREVERSESSTVAEVERKCIEKIESKLLPSTGCPLGSELLAILTELEKNLAQFEKSVRDWETNPVGDRPFATPEQLKLWNDALETLGKLPKLPSETSLGQREKQSADAVYDRVAKIFEWTGNDFEDHYQGYPLNKTEKMFALLKSEWSRFVRLTPMPEHKEIRPWSDRMERDYSRP